MNTIWLTVVALAVALAAYTYIGYPLFLAALAAVRRVGIKSVPNAELESATWPMISIAVPAYNEESQIAATLERLLQADYPPEKRQIVVVSDASSDRTDEIVREFGDRGVQLIRLSKRSGKTAAENAARDHLRGEIIVNTDASVRVDRDAIKPLVAAFTEPAVGLASGRDISVAVAEEEGNAGESGYVGYEMWIRDLETRVSGIVGASGCLYAIRADLHRALVPEALSRDFASAMIAREHGYRAVSVPDAVCYVPRTTSLRREYRRKVRTMTRGMETLYFKRHLLNPFRYGAFAWMLFSHKVCRWLVPWAGVLAAIAVAGLALTESWARWPLAAILGLIASALAAYSWPEDARVPRWLALPGFAVLGNTAALVAGVRAIRGELNPTWEPTRRDPSPVRRENVRGDDYPRGSVLHNGTDGLS